MLGYSSKLGRPEAVHIILSRTAGKRPLSTKTALEPGPSFLDFCIPLLSFTKHLVLFSFSNIILPLFLPLFHRLLDPAGPLGPFPFALLLGPFLPLYGLLQQCLIIVYLLGFRPPPGGEPRFLFQHFYPLIVIQSSHSLLGCLEDG